MTLIPRVRELMNAAGLNDVRLIAGGIIPQEDGKALLAVPGVAGVFGPGTHTGDVVTFIAGLFPDRDAGTNRQKEKA
jgi:methylmalonyl-CoA mutase cobalamin-binding domain/chain